MGESVCVFRTMRMIHHDVGVLRDDQLATGVVRSVLTRTARASSVFPLGTSVQHGVGRSEFPVLVETGTKSNKCCPDVGFQVSTVPASFFIREPAMRLRFIMTCSNNARFGIWV